MKEKALLVFLVLVVLVSVFFTYERSFVWKNFELINSEEELEVEEGTEAEFVDDETTGGSPSEMLIQ